MPDKPQPTANIYGEEFTRADVFDLTSTVTSAGWAQVNRLFEAWKSERMEELLQRDGIPAGMTLTEHLLLTAGRAEISAMSLQIPEMAAAAHESLKEIEAEAADA